MASYDCLYPQAELATDGSSSITWGDVEYATEGAFANADYPSPEGDERLFLTIAVMRGRLDDTTGSVAILGVTRDLEVGIETRLPADIDGDDWTIVDHDEIPAAVAHEPMSDRTIPNGPRKFYREVLERAHDVDQAASVDDGFHTARELATDGGIEEVYRRETIVATDDGIAIGQRAADAQEGSE